MNSEQLNRYAQVKWELRKHVIATMPIRLILVNQTEPSSQLTLIGRDRVVDRVIDSMKKVGAYGDVNTMMGIAKSNARFGILSHTWEDDGEINYEDFTKLHPDAKILQAPGYVKLQKFCGVLPPGIEFAWADTVCIDKSGSAEMDETIRSMFRWYQCADICIVHLAQTTSFENMGRDKWFTRGWTLQELLAPPRLKYYGQDWHALTESKNDKERDSSNQRVYEAVLEATKIPDNEIIRFTPQARSNLAMRMSWMGNRVTTREEDISYSLMGIFGVSMSPSYGEGSERAFLRLFKEILDISNCPDLFNWAFHPLVDFIHPSRMLPSSPSCFLSYAPELGFDNSRRRGSIEPPLLTSIGLRIRVLLLSVEVVFDSSSSLPDENRESSDNDSDYSDNNSDSSDADMRGYSIVKASLKFGIPTDQTVIPVRFVAEEYFQEILESPNGEVALGLINACNETHPIPDRCLMVVLERSKWASWRKLSTKEVLWFDFKHDPKYRELLTTDKLIEHGVARGFETVYL